MKKLTIAIKLFFAILLVGGKIWAAQFDGQTFQVRLILDVTVFQDTLSFFDGQLASQHFAGQEFSPSSYSVRHQQSSSVLLWESHGSGTRGNLDWTGTMDGGKIDGTVLWHPASGGVLTYRVEMVPPLAAPSDGPVFFRLYPNARLDNKNILALIKALKKAPVAKQDSFIQSLAAYGAEVLPYALDLAEQHHVRFAYPTHDVILPVAFPQDYRVLALGIIESIRDVQAIPDLKRFLREDIDLAAAARDALLRMPGPLPSDVQRALDDRHL